MATVLIMSKYSTYKGIMDYLQTFHGSYLFQCSLVCV